MPQVIHNRVRIYYEYEGRGTPLLLLHGLGDSLWGWRELGYIAALKPQCKLILMDLRGHGFSDKPHDPAAYALETMVRDVVAVLDALNLARVHCCGYSLGGLIGFGLARHAPERLHSLLLGGAHPFGGDMSFWRRLFARNLEEWAEVVLQQTAGTSASMRFRLLANDTDALRALTAMDRPDVSDVLSTISVPCQLFVGSADPARARVERAAAAIPHADCVTLEGLNHCETYLHTERIIPLITDFIGKATAPSGACLAQGAPFRP